MAMAEYVNITTQTVAPDENVLFLDSKPCNRGLVYHREGSGIFTLSGSRQGCNSFARYKIEFNANIAPATGATAAPIAVALAIGGEVIQANRAIVTPNAVGDYFNVTVVATVDVPCGCCTSIAIKNAQAGVDEVLDIQPITVANPNLTIDRIA